MKSLLLTLILQTLVITLPVDKGISAINFTLDGFDVVTASATLQKGKQLDYNKVDNEVSKYVIYGLNRDLLLEDNKLYITGYQSKQEINLEDVTGSSPDASEVSIRNWYERI